jgi:hypothetical protein
MAMGALTFAEKSSNFYPLLVFPTFPDGSIIGVLDTPMYPARYYAGYLRRYPGGELAQTDNATCYYHRTEEAANAAALKMFQQATMKGKTQ